MSSLEAYSKKSPVPALPLMMSVVSLHSMPLPAFTAPAIASSDVIARHQDSLAAAEKSFSDHAQNVGLKTAFRDFGREDAMNMYAGAGFAVLAAMG